MLLDADFVPARFELEVFLGGGIAACKRAKCDGETAMQSQARRGNWFTSDVVSASVDRHALSNVEVVEVHHCAPIHHDVMALDQIALR